MYIRRKNSRGSSILWGAQERYLKNLLKKRKTCYYAIPYYSIENKKSNSYHNLKNNKRSCRKIYKTF